MNNKFPIYLAKIEISLEGERKFVKSTKPHTMKVWGTPYNEFFFKLRGTLSDHPNCDFDCPPDKKFFCCENFGCKDNCGFFEWEEIPFFSDKERDKILSSWDNESGFQGENGCVLSRNLRSYICLNYVCRYNLIKNKK